MDQLRQARSLRDILCLFCLVAKSWLTLCDPVKCSLPGSSVHGIFQARVLEWGAIAFSGVCVEQAHFCKMFVKRTLGDGRQLNKVRRLEYSNVLWPPDSKNRLIGKDCAAGKD